MRLTEQLQPLNDLIELYNRDLASRESRLEQLPLSKIIALLGSDNLREACKNGNITVALVKPELVSATHGFEGLTDNEIKDQLLAEIELPLEKLFEISFKMPGQIVNDWYGGTPRERQIELQPLKNPGYSSRWQEYFKFMTDNPSTYVLLYSEDGNAVKEWRSQMGDNWNIEEIIHEEPDSLRARYAVDNHNNLFHGSDSPENAQRELDLLIKALQWYDRKLNQEI